MAQAGWPLPHAGAASWRRRFEGKASQFPLWKLGTSPFNDIFQGRGMEHWLALLQRHYLYNDISSHRPLHSVNSWEGPGWAKNAGCQGRALGEGAGLSGNKVCRPSEVPGRQGEEGSWGQGCYDPFLLLCCLPRAPKGKDRGCRAQRASALSPSSSTALYNRPNLAWATLCGRPCCSPHVARPPC